jgi:hypothetical protein
MFPDRAQSLDDAPFDHLLTILLRQFRRPLVSQGVELTEADIAGVVREMIERQPLSEKAEAVRAALVNLIAESESVLGQWNLTFAQSLKTLMDAIPGWETTADFLEIANEKSNAELRIVIGSALLAALGDLRHADYLLQVIEHDPVDTDAVVARRVLSFVSGINDVDDWQIKIREWLEKSD